MPRGAKAPLQPPSPISDRLLEALGRLDWLWEQSPDLVLIALGANDTGWHPLAPEQTVTAVSRMVECIRWHGANHHNAPDLLLVVTGGNNPIGPDGPAVAASVAALRAMAGRLALPVADVRAHVVAVTDDGTRWGEYHNGPQDCHPNDAGHAA